MTEIENKALAHLKEHFVNCPLPESVTNAELFTKERRLEDFERMPDDYKQIFINMLCSFGAGEDTRLTEIIAEAKKTSHSDLSFGMVVKQILSRK